MDEELLAELENLRKENENLKAPVGAPKKIYFKVGEKGGVSVYGLNRFPVTLYKEQWERVIEHIDELKQFLEDNAHRLRTKPTHHLNQE